MEGLRFDCNLLSTQPALVLGSDITKSKTA